MVRCPSDAWLLVLILCICIVCAIYLSCRWAYVGAAEIFEIQTKSDAAKVHLA